MRAKLERGNVAGHIEVVGASGREEVFSALGAEGDIATVLVARRKAYSVSTVVNGNGRITHRRAAKGK
jgi:hypothetical protein